MKHQIALFGRFKSYDAIVHNQRVVNNYGRQKFLITHDGGVQSEWSAANKKHLMRLLKIQKNLGYIVDIEHIQDFF